MRLRATYVRLDANPFLPRFEDFCRQFCYAVTGELPEDADLVQLEKFAREKTPENYRFVRMEKY